MEKAALSNLARTYNLIDWIDFILVILVIFEFTRPAQGELYEPLGDHLTYDTLDNILNFVPSFGLGLYLLSLAVSLGAVLVSRLLRKRGEITRPRYVIRCIIWGIWIPIDLYFIVVTLGLL